MIIGYYETIMIRQSTLVIIQQPSAKLVCFHAMLSKYHIILLASSV